MALATCAPQAGWAAQVDPAPDAGARAEAITDCDAQSEEQIVVCGRRTGRSPYRLAPDAGHFDPAGPVDSVSRERNRLLDVGATGIGSCSTVGPGGWTGCDLIRWKEKHEQWDGHRRGEPKVAFRVGPLKPTLVD